MELAFGFAEAQPAHGVAVEIERRDLLRAAPAQFGIDAALGDAPEHRRRARGQEMGPGPAGPAGGDGHGLGGLRGCGREGHEIVEGHHDVRAELGLDIDYVFRRQEELGPVQMRSEGHAVRPDLGQRGHAVDLEPAAVGQDGPGPGDETVQTAHVSDRVRAGAQEQMIGIAQDELGAELGDPIVGQAFDRTLAGHRREGRRPDVAVGRMDEAGPCRARGLGRLDFEGAAHGANRK